MTAYRERIGDAILFKKCQRSFYRDRIEREGLDGGGSPAEIDAGRKKQTCGSKEGFAA